MNKKKLVAKLISDCEAIKKLAQEEGRSYSEEELRTLEESLARVDVLQKEIELEERMSGVGAEKETPKNNDNKNEQRAGSQGEKVPNGQVEVTHKPTYRTLGEQLVDIAAVGTGKATQETYRRLDEVRAASGLNATTGSDGGFLVQTDFTTQLLTLAHDAGTLTSRMTRIPIGPNSDGLEAPYVDETSRATGSRWGGVRVYRRAEAAQVTASKPKIGNWELRLEDLMGLCYATGRMIQDATAMEGIFRTAFLEEFDFVIHDEAIRGTGVGQMLGVLNSGCLVSVAKEVGQAADTVVFENVLKMWARMPYRFRQNAVWTINQEVEVQLPQMNLTVGTAGIPVYMPANGVAGQPFGTLFGRPVIPLEQASALGDVGDIILGDWRQYITIDKGGMQTAESMHVRFVYDEMTYRFLTRINGAPKYKSAITPYKGTSTLSPFVTLAERA